MIGVFILPGGAEGTRQYSTVFIGDNVMRMHIIRMMQGLMLSLVLTGLAQAQTTSPVYRNLPINKQILMRNARSTRFNPSVHGMAFVNSFTNSFIPEFDVRTAGLCGGMVYTALDFYNANRPVPNWPYPPAEHEVLRQYMYDRQVTSTLSNADKWMEVMINPFGSRNDEFFNWGLQGGPGGRLTELKSSIDAGTPVPLGLRSCGDSCKGDHQVLAIGYDFGRYKGDLGAYKTDMKIKIYDPNHPGRTMTLIPDLARKRYVLAEDANSAQNPRKGWLTWFVDAKYSRVSPPQARPDRFARDGKIHGLAIGFLTGNDDLRGGYDDVDVSVSLHNADDEFFRNVNQRKRWVAKGEEWVRLDLKTPVFANQIQKIKIGKPNYNSPATADNWDLKNLNIRGIGNGINVGLFNKPNNTRVQGLVRMTKATTSYTAWINPRPPAASGASATPVLNERSTLERNTERPGGYYRRVVLRQKAGFRQCQNFCAKEAQCKSWTFKKTPAGQRPLCFLKSDITAKRRNAGYTSGVKFKYLGEPNAR
jgi:PAN domain